MFAFRGTRIGPVAAWLGVDRNRHAHVYGAAYGSGLGRCSERPGWFRRWGRCRLVTVVEAYQGVMWAATALTVAAVLRNIVWPGE
jgi:hypothetical protein